MVFIYVLFNSIAVKHPMLSDMFHSKDVWHKTSKLTAKLNEVQYDVLNMVQLIEIIYHR